MDVGGVKVAYLFVDDASELLPEIEKALIKYFQPLLNLTGQNKKNSTVQRKKILKVLDKRFTLAPIGEYYHDLLIVDAWITGRSQGVQGTSLLCAELREREPLIRPLVEYLAKKRGITADELWQQILNGEAADGLDEDEK